MSYRIFYNEHSIFDALAFYAAIQAVLLLYSYCSIALFLYTFGTAYCKFLHGNGLQSEPVIRQRQQNDNNNALAINNSIFNIINHAHLDIKNIKPLSLWCCGGTKLLT